MFFVIPNLTVLYLHMISKRARLPQKIANIVLRKKDDEITLPEIKLSMKNEINEKIKIRR